MVPIRRQNVTVAAKATKVTLASAAASATTTRTWGTSPTPATARRATRSRPKPTASSARSSTTSRSTRTARSGTARTARRSRPARTARTSRLRGPVRARGRSGARGATPTPRATASSAARSPSSSRPTSRRPTTTGSSCTRSRRASRAGATTSPSPAPTPSTITFAPEPQFWQKGSTQTVEIRIGDVDQAYSYGFGAVVDLLLYKADDADPVGTLAVYAQVAGNKLSVDYPVPAGLTGTDFRLRAIEYTRGLDVYSKPFAIGDAAPVPAPTAKPSTAAPSLAPTADTFDEPTTVVVCREESLKHNRCPLNPVGDGAQDAIANNAHDGDAVLALKVAASTTFDYTPAATGRYVFQAWTATQGAFTSPTYTVATTAP